MILLRRLTDEGLERLLDLAVADTDPHDVMPPGWSPDRPDRFRDFYRGLRRDAYEIVADGRTVGMIRLTPDGETGMWLARAARGRGLGTAALRRLVEEAPGRDVRTVIAHTTTDNTAALRVLTALDAQLHVTGTAVTARIPVPAEPPADIADPAALLPAYLDFHRDTVLRKIAGMPERELRTSRLPSGWTPLGLVKHLGYVEMRWLRHVFRGEDIAHPPAGLDVERAEWDLDEHDTTDRVRAFYLEQCAHSRAIAAASRLSDRAARQDLETPPPTLAWILFHLLQEYARHVGHLDVARELSDGVVGM